MVSIIRQYIKIPDEYGLPQELAETILEKADSCSKLVKLTDTGISVFNFNTKKLIRNIKSKYYFQLSVSNCGKFAVGSNEQYPIDIWNINTGLSIKIDSTFENQLAAPVHTFSLNNELLVTYKNSIYSYEFSVEQNSFINNHVYEIPDEQDMIIYIKPNYSDNTFACASSSGKVYIFNSLTKTFVRRLDISINPVEDYIISLTFNKHILFVIANDIKLIFNLKKNSSIILQKPKSPLRSIIYEININEFHLLPCLKKAIGSSNGLSLVWDVKTGRIIKRLNIPVSSLKSLTPEGTQLVSCERHKNIINVVDLSDLI